LYHQYNSYSTRNKIHLVSSIT
jgi:hypothetical protein